MCLKKLFMFCVVSVLVSVSVMAWPISFTKPTAGVMTNTSESVTESTETSSETSNSSTASSTEPEIDLESKKVLKGEDLEVFKIVYADLKQNVSDLQSENAKLLKETKSKFFADLGLAFGFKNKSVTYGFAGDIGMRFGKSFIGKLGATYMFGSFSDIKNISWNIENLTVSATVGWEW